MTISEMIAEVQAARTAAGLRLEWIIPAIPGSVEKRNYVAFAKDEEQKAAWIANGIHKGWERIL